MGKRRKERPRDFEVLQRIIPMINAHVLEKKKMSRRQQTTESGKAWLTLLPAHPRVKVRIKGQGRPAEDHDTSRTDTGHVHGTFQSKFRYEHQEETFQHTVVFFLSRGLLGDLF